MLNVALFFVVLVLVFGGISLLTRTKATRITTKEQLQVFDYASGIACIEASVFEWYPSALYTPAQFARGVAARPAEITREPNQYGTYRLVLQLQPGVVYGLTSYSATYAQALYVDGVLLSAYGKPGESAAQTEHKTGYFTVYFTAADTTEIVVQRAEFVHSQGGQLYPLYLGPQAMITQMVGGIAMRGNINVGCMLTAGLFFFGIFLFFQKRLPFLWFSLACVCIAIRTLYTDHKLIMVLFPRLAWAPSHRFEYVATLGFAVFFTLFIGQIFFWKFPKPFLWGGIAFAAATLLLILFAPSTVYTSLIPALQVVGLSYLLALGALCVRLSAKNPDLRRREHAVILGGTAAAIGFALLDFVRYLFRGQYDDLNFAQTGMMVFVFANTLALALSFAYTEQELAHAKQNEQEIEQTRRLLQRLNALKTEYMANISHELKTPLTVISGYAQLTHMELDAGSVSEGTYRNLQSISVEARRLADLAGELLNLSAEKENLDMIEPVWVPAVLDRMAAVCAPILKRRSNRLALDVASGTPPVRANFEMLLQVLINLATNADRHIQNDVLSVRVCPPGAGAPAGFVQFEVADRGDGIPPELLGRVFERGVSGDNGTGLGLSICKDAVELFGGTIQVQSAPQKGTTVTFTVPVADAWEE